MAEFDGTGPVSDLGLACRYASPARERPHYGINGGRNGSRSVFGELIVTALTNDLMPLVRYRIGDLVECSRGPGGARYVVHGRVEDAFVTAGGRRVTTHDVDQCFRGIEGILHYQLLEVAGDSYALRFVPHQAGPSIQEKSVLNDRLKELMELQAPVRLETTDTLLAESSGKFRLGYPARKTPARP